MYEQIPDVVEDEATANATQIDPAVAVYPPPFRFHPNLLTSLLGFSDNSAVESSSLLAFQMPAQSLP